MSKNRNVEIIRKGDWTRALLSETTPAEIPILISNDGFYRNMNAGKFPDALNVITKAFLKPTSDKRFSIPFSYKITKDSQSLRRLALPHPRAQLEIVSFYGRYHSLVLHYCGRGSFSIRRPEKIASHYYSEGRNEEVFQFKSQEIATPDTDKSAKHSVSIFSYKRFQRLYKFFSSPTFSNLERKYRYMESLDVNKCFDSIYTHSIAWATKSKSEAKRSTKAESFGGQFDRLMQLMNYNETNGIVIGPEVSRLFAEIILDSVDVEVERRLELKKYRLGVDYSIYRYVDNIYVFHNDEKVFLDIRNEIVAALDFYKMSLNSAKAEHSCRPFFTNKSMAIAGAEEIRDLFIDRPIETIYIQNRLTSYINLKNKSPTSLKHYSNALRKACHLAQQDYESVSGYLIASQRKRLQRVLSSRSRFERFIEDNPNELSGTSPNEYRHIVSKYIVDTIDLCMHTYTLAPSVPSSLDVATILILSAETLKQIGQDHLLHVRERLQMWMSRLMSCSSIRSLIDNEHAVPIEVLNIICALKSFGYDGQHFEEILERTIPARNSLSYFEIVSALFVLSDLPPRSKKLNELFAAAKDKLEHDFDLGVSSEATHLLLDLLSCPYIERKERKALYRSVISAYNDYARNPDISAPPLPAKSTNAEIEEMLSYMETHPWFVNWQEVDLLRLIEKKKLRNGYS